MKDIPSVGELVFAIWLDSNYATSWSSEKPENNILICHSVGWVSALSKDSITLTANKTMEDKPQRLGDISIPLCSIQRLCLLQHGFSEDVMRLAESARALFPSVA